MLNRYAGVFAFLLDGARPVKYGGTGQTLIGSWRAAGQRARIILSGRLKVENVAAAIRAVRPYAVDVGSGDRTKPGKKDHAPPQKNLSTKFAGPSGSSSSNSTVERESYSTMSSIFNRRPPRQGRSVLYGAGYVPKR